MVKLDARRENGRISLSEGSFDHLLACLDNQKFVGEGPPNGDALAMGQEAFEATQAEIQVAIDSFNRQCREFQHIPHQSQKEEAETCPTG